MRVGASKAEGGQGSAATPFERHVLTLEDLAEDENDAESGDSWRTNGILMGF